MPDCIGVRFDNGPKVHYVEVPSNVPNVGERCVVSTKRGLELGLVRTQTCNHDRPIGHFVRAALSEDLETFEMLKERAEDLKWLLKAKARSHAQGAKVVAAEFTLDERVLVVSYSSEGQVPLRELTGALMNYTDARIEFINVGPRDQARILGGLGACGGGTCSSTWLQGFSAVGIRMARDQQLPLNPEKISGPCGRLMCCLQYEHKMYEELLRSLPRKGGRACHTKSGSCGRVVKLHPLKQTVNVAVEGGPVTEFPVSELEPAGRGKKRG